MQVAGKALTVDVGEMSQEVWRGIDRWMRFLEANPGSSEASNVEKYLPSLVRVRSVQVPVAPTFQGGPQGHFGNVTFTTINKTS